jgi:hypothetical protein
MPNMLALIDNHALINEILDAWKDALGADLAAYRGHAYRVFNWSRLVAGTDRHDTTFALVAATHDLGIWSDRTFDYLPPSIARACEEIEKRAIPVDEAVVAAAIDNHHRLHAYRGPALPEVVESVRRADLADLSRGWIRSGPPRARYAELTTAFPFAGFHGLILRKALAWAMRHPLRPAPMLRM